MSNLRVFPDRGVQPRQQHAATYPLAHNVAPICRARELRSARLWRVIKATPEGFERVWPALESIGDYGTRPGRAARLIAGLLSVRFHFDRPHALAIAMAWVAHRRGVSYCSLRELVRQESEKENCNG